MDPTHQIQRLAQLLTIPIPRHISHNPRPGTGIPIPRLHSLGRPRHGRRACAHDMNTCTQGPNIALAGMERDFRALVRQGADEVVCGSLGGGEAEIGEDEVRVAVGVVVGFEEDVGGFDVAVDDGVEAFVGTTTRVEGEAVVAGVDEGEGFGELEEDVPDEGFGDVGLVGDVGVC